MADSRIVKVPAGFICVTPVDEMGTTILKASCVHIVIYAPAPQSLIISPDGESEPTDYNVIVGGVAGGTRFSYKVEEDIEEVLRQLDRASLTYAIERITGAEEYLTAFNPEVDHN